MTRCEVYLDLNLVFQDTADGYPQGHSGVGCRLWATWADGELTDALYGVMYRSNGWYRTSILSPDYIYKITTNPDADGGFIVTVLCYGALIFRGTFPEMGVYFNY